MSKKRKDLVTLNHLPGLLLASEAECERWIEEGLIPVAEHKSVRKWGRTVQERLFDPDIVAALAREVPKWRRRDAAESHTHRSEAARRAHTRRETRAHRDEPIPSGGAAHRRRKYIATALREKTGIAVSEAIRASLDSESKPDRGSRHSRHRPEPEHDFARYRIEFEHGFLILPNVELSVAVTMTIAEPPEVESIVHAPSRFSSNDAAAAAEFLAPQVKHLRDATLDACEETARTWRDENETYLSPYEESDRSAILRAIRSAAGRLAPLRITTEDEPDEVARELRTALDEIRTKATTRRLRHLREAQIREASGYESYAAIFPLARSLNRQVLFLAGPTNSGKTHEALRLATEAETAEILSPLRLLALEHYERLSERGLSAGMITGEERVVSEGATHIARTIETLDLGRVVDVCVIDEVQMLDDHSRGWAWTQAIVGAPARLVVLTGAPEAIPLVEHLLAMTGEPLKVRILKRKGELRVESEPVDLNKLAKGDAVIAFSRAEIHDLRTRLVRSGRSIATIYGALGPEVRRAEAARFRNREAEILVATDAIGMGLNIGPLRRVVFSTLSKFDGSRRRQLSPMEIKQIAGRAGRFGHHDTGLVTALSEAGSYHLLQPAIEGALTQESAKLRGKAYVRPNRETVLSASEVLHTDRLGRILQYLDDTLVAGHPDLRMADLEEMIGLAQLLDTVSLPILDRLSYSMAPVDARDGLAVDMLLAWACQHAKHGWVEPPNFGVNADLLKLEARVKIVTTWLWLGQRYPNAYTESEYVLELRSDLNAKIEEKLVASSVSRTRDRRGKKGGGPDRRKGGRRERQNAKASVG